jgi:DNA-binding NtrC family response regulator
MSKSVLRSLEGKRRDEMLALEFPKTGPFSVPRIHSERVLVVEDDCDLQAILELAIGSVAPDLGVDWAENVPDAITQLNESTKSYRLVLSDFLLDSRASGFDLRNWCTVHRPDLRFAMMSAYPVGMEAVDIANCRFLPKPFTIIGLRRFLASVLDEHDPGSYPRPRMNS